MSLCPLLSPLRFYRAAPSLARYQSTTPPLPSPVPLPYELAEPKQRKFDETLVIAHGLFGSKQNWRSMIKSLAEKLGMPVYAIDLRNHGTAPHQHPHTYLAMASDISAFFSEHNLSSSSSSPSIHLMGHSMGGKAVMTTALHPSLNTPLKSLISVDMSPAVGKISPEFTSYTTAMLAIQEREASSKAEADKILAETEPALPIRQFLLTNSLLKDGKVSFRVPLELLRDAIPEIGEFPFSPGEVTFDRPTLFIKGAKSKYINHKNIPVARQFFPRMRLEELDTGHWVNAEKPMEFMALCKEFIDSTRS